MKLGMLFFGRKRPGFDPDWGREIEGKVRAQISADYPGAVLRDTPVIDEGSLAEAVANFRAEGVDVPVLLQPTMSDGRLAVRIGQLWDGPLVLWATPERPGADKVTACSLVGTHVFAANLRQHGYPFELAYGMPGAPATRAELDAACRAAFAVKTLRAAKIGLVGYHAPGFVDMHADPFDLSGGLGAGLWHTGLHELLDRMASVPGEAVETDLGTVLEMGLPMDGVAREDLASNSRFYLALKTLAVEENLAGIALREWPELPNATGYWVYLAIARLLNDGLPVSCEGDVDGAVTSLAGCALGLGPGYLSDWLAHDAETVTLWHGGCAPFALCDPAGTPHGPRIGRHFNSNTPAVVNARIAPDQPLTLARIWRCDGVYWLTAEDALSRAPERLLAGTTGCVELLDDDPQEWFRELVFAGMPHHLAAFPGHHAERFHRMARLLGVEVV